MKCIKCRESTNQRYWWTGLTAICDKCWWKSWEWFQAKRPKWSDRRPPGKLWSAKEAKATVEEWLAIL